VFHFWVVSPLSVSGSRLPFLDRPAYIRTTSLEQVYRAFSSTTDTAMPPIFNKPTVEKYDYIVLGGGSGGSGTAVSALSYWAFEVGDAHLEFKRRAAKYGKKVAVVEMTAHLGGTCVNVGTLSFVIVLGSGGQEVCANDILLAQRRLCTQEGE
jgi:hypothetical protein